MYLNVIELMESFGVTEDTIENWVAREGLPHLHDRGRLLFDRAEVAQWADSRGLTTKAGFLAGEHAAFRTSHQLGELLETGGIWRDIPGEAVNTVLTQVIERLPSLATPVRKMLIQRLTQPGGLVWAPIGRGLALPHPSVRMALGRDRGALALIFLSSPAPIGEESPDGIPVTRLLFFLAPSPRAHLDLLARISRLLSQKDADTMLNATRPDHELKTWMESEKQEAARGDLKAAREST